MFIGTDSIGDNDIAQADTLMLLSVDHKNKEYGVLPINRDTMTDVPVLDMFGQKASTQFQQIALAHTYSTDETKNSKNTRDAVADLCHLPSIHGYYSLSMPGVSVFVDQIGGVPVEVTSDFSAVDPDLKAGNTITLSGEQALKYVRSRKDVDDQTNISRMARQKVFMSSLRQVLETKNDKDLIGYIDSLQKYSSGSIGSQTMVDLFRQLQEYKEIPDLKIEGEAKVENDVWAFYPDESSLQNHVIRLFYEKA